MFITRYKLFNSVVFSFPRLLYPLFPLALALIIRRKGRVRVLTVDKGTPQHRIGVLFQFYLVGFVTTFQTAEVFTKMDCMYFEWAC